MNEQPSKALEAHPTPGDRIHWFTVSGHQCFGTLLRWHDDIAAIEGDDGRFHHVKLVKETPADDTFGAMPQ